MFRRYHARDPGHPGVDAVQLDAGNALKIILQLGEISSWDMMTRTATGRVIIRVRGPSVGGGREPEHWEPRPVELGDWIVRSPDGAYEVWAGHRLPPSLRRPAGMRGADER